MAKQNKREFRALPQTITVDQNKVTGYFAKFNSLSEDLGGFREQIAPGAFARSLKQSPDVCAFVDHDSSKIIGRTSADTLSVTEDEVGLAFTVELPDTSYARDLKVSMARGDIGKCSFGFFTNEDNWAEVNGSLVRTLLDVTVFEGSIVSLPAYTDTDAQLRSLFPDGKPEARTNDKRDLLCACDCEQCQDGDCAECSDSDCTDPHCEGSQAERSICDSDRHKLEIRLALAQRGIYS